GNVPDLQPGALRASKIEPGTGRDYSQVRGADRRLGENKGLTHGLISHANDDTRRFDNAGGRLQVGGGHIRLGPSWRRLPSRWYFSLESIVIRHSSFFLAPHFCD